MFELCTAPRENAIHVPMINPLDAPEKRPSVMRAVELPRPAPIKAAVGPVIKSDERRVTVSRLPDLPNIYRRKLRNMCFFRWAEAHIPQAFPEHPSGLGI